MQHHRRKVKGGAPDIEETKEHVLAAGRELLFAAKGAIGFIKAYAEKSAEMKSNPELSSFFNKALATADEMGKSLSSVLPVKSAEGIAKSVLGMMAGEMKSERVHTKRPKSAKKRRR